MSRHELGLVGLGLVERARLLVGHAEALVVEAAQLAHAREVVVAQQDGRLRRRVRRQPRQDAEAVLAGLRAHGGLAEVEVVAH